MAPETTLRHCPGVLASCPVVGKSGAQSSRLLGAPRGWAPNTSFTSLSFPPASWGHPLTNHPHPRPCLRFCFRGAQLREMSTPLTITLPPSPRFPGRILRRGNVDTPTPHPSWPVIYPQRAGHWDIRVGKGHPKEKPGWGLCAAWRDNWGLPPAAAHPLSHYSPQQGVEGPLALGVQGPSSAPNPPEGAPGARAAHVQLDWLTCPMQILVQIQVCQLSSATEMVPDNSALSGIPHGTIALAPKASTAGGAILQLRAGLGQPQALAGICCQSAGWLGSTSLPSSPGQPGLVLTLVRGSQEKGEAAAWSWWTHTSVPTWWPKQVTWPVQIQGVGNRLCII